jgi:hypothetical protein
VYFVNSIIGVVLSNGEILKRFEREKYCIGPRRGKDNAEAQRAQRSAETFGEVADGKVDLHVDTR